MDYSTFQAKKFFIKKDSTLPELKYPLIQKIREKYDITEEMLENVAITFSMTDAETGLFRVANAPANLVISNDREANPDETQYTLTYRFRLTQTNRTGRFLGEFKIDFLGENCGKLTLPVEDKIEIIISDSITKTTVV